ncbi:MAG: ISKra4 family transposase [Chloroflexi bacterium]|nr:ISKra4 family transposase [Chloroflexota bacterium]
MTRAIPEQIVAAVTTLAESLAGWCEEGRDGRLEQHEAAVLERVQQVLPQVLEAVVEVATSGLAPRVREASAACPSCGRRVKPHQERPRQVLTQCGAIVIERPWYTCERCHHGWSVVETTLGVASRRRSSNGLVEWLVRLGATTDYRESAELLAELTGLVVGSETIRRECIRVGTAIRTAEAAATRQTQRTREAAGRLDPAPGLLVLEADGAMIQFTDGWHEVKVGMVAGWDGDRLVAPSDVAARETAAEFGPRLATEAARRGALEVERWEGSVTRRSLAVLRPALILADGAAWIWNLADEYVDQRIEVSDFYHAAEHLAAVATACCPDPAAATVWLDARKGELLTQGPLPVLDAFDRLKPATPQAAEVRRVERASFASRVDRMAYPALRLDGLPIGSGAIESAANHVVQRRMKRSGMRWSKVGGDAILALRARHRSRRPLAA